MRFAAPAILQRLGIRAAVIAFAIGTAVFAVQSPSMADDDYFTWCSYTWVSCQTGAKVSQPPSDVYACAAELTSYTTVCIDYYGDIVYVFDGSSDGNSAMGSVIADAGSVTDRFCRNPHGSNTWARCNFDWVESANKEVYGGVRISYIKHEPHLLWSFDNK